MVRQIYLSALVTVLATTILSAAATPQAAQTGAAWNCARSPRTSMSCNTFQITEEGSAHSTSDLTLYIPERRVFAMGDLFKSEIHTGPGDTVYRTFDGGKPFMTIADKVMARKLPVDTYVPGHDPVHIGRGVADLQELRRYFETMRAEVSRMIKQGKTEQQVLAEFKTPAPFDKYGQAAGIVRFLPLYYRDLKAEGVRP